MNLTEKNSKKIPIDLEKVMERVGQDKEFLYELLNIYTEDFPENIKELEQSIAQKKHDSIQRLGHYLKGSSANLGLIELEKESFTMECAGKEKDTQKAQKTLKKLQSEFDILKKYIKEEMSG
ncbi:MAG: Hpt domain-containing protein [Candidatus Aminicenantes bacterium]